MKKILRKITAAVLAGCCALPAASAIVDRIDPPHWWAGMADSSLQLMVYGDGVARADVTVKYPGVTVDSIVRPDGPNHLFVYLSVAPDTQPGDATLTFTLDGRSQRVEYQLKKRDRAPEDYPGFDQSDVLYLIMPDRFAKGSEAAETGSNSLRNKAEIDRSNPNRRHGGDIAGMRRHLDYIDSLGVTAVWVNPVLENDLPGGSYHGYATTDYYRVDPRFGSNDEWNEFVAAAHDKGIKVVMDMIFNHCGYTHPWLEDRPMADWINFPDEYVQTNHRLSTVYDPYASDYDRRRTVDGWFVPSMPDLNQRNPHLMRYLAQNSIWWIEESKIDGIRMDTHPYADLEAMAGWIKAVEREYPRFNIVGECWYGNEGSSAFWQRHSAVNRLADPELPTVMDFVLAINARDAFNSPTRGRDGLNKLYDHLAMDFLFPDPTRILTFLDNHDTDRFLDSLPDDLARWKQAQAFLLTSRGIPQIYYGTEALMHGNKDRGDGLIRLDMPGGFPGDTVSVFTAEGRTPLQREAFDFLSRLLHFRRGSRAISEGSLKHFAPEQGVYIYERRLGDEQVVVMMNGTDDTVDLDMTPTLEILPFGTRLRDVITDTELVVEPEMTFAPRALYIAVRQ